MFSAIYVGRQLGDISPATLALYLKFADQICDTAAGLTGEQALELLCTKYKEYALFRICDTFTSSVPQITLLRSNATGFLLQAWAVPSNVVFLGSPAGQTVEFPSFSDPQLPVSAPALSFATTKAIQFRLPSNVGVVQVIFPSACVAPLLLVGVEVPPSVKVTSVSPSTLALNATIIGIPAVQNGSLSNINLLNYGANSPEQVSLFTTQQAHLENTPANVQPTVLLLCSVNQASVAGGLNVVVRAWARPAADPSLSSVIASGSTSQTFGRVTQYTIIARDSVTHVVPRYNGTQRVTIQVGEDSIVDVGVFLFPDETATAAALNSESRSTNFELRGFQSAQILMANPQYTKASFVTVRTEDIDPSAGASVALGLGLGLGLGALACLVVGGVFLWRYKKKKQAAEMGVLPDPDRDGLRRANSYRGLQDIRGYAADPKSSEGKAAAHTPQALTTSGDEAYNQNVQLSIPDLANLRTSEQMQSPNE
jgi:hypothetical protein